MNKPKFGQSYGRLTFLRLLPKSTADNHRLGLWKCTCGNKKELPVSRVVCGYVYSCGCFALERSSELNKKHGMRGTAEYNSWAGMIQRCHNPASKDFYRYGACGIIVAPEWRESFETFLAHIGPRPKGKKSIDRIDPLKGYIPGNVRWATPQEQSLNRRDLTVISTPRGVMPLVEYAKLIGLTKGAARNRLNRAKLEGCCRV